MLRAFGLGAILYGFWLLLSGHYTPLLLGLGVASCGLAVYLCLRMDMVDDESVGLYVNPRFWLYLPWLLREIFVANVAVAKIILSPSLPISPSMCTFKGSMRADLYKALYANSITLTPGTITTGVEGDEFEIHALTVEDLDTEEQNEMNRRCCAVEGGA